MFGDISIWAWMGAAIMFGIGGGTGFFIARQIKDKRTLALEEKLATTQSELAGYKGDVNQHFLKTSLLLGKLTNNYREVYEHLATGAQKLCNEKPNTPKLDLPDTKILPAMDVVDAEVSTIEQANEPAIEALQNAEQEMEQAAELATEDLVAENLVAEAEEATVETATKAESSTEQIAKQEAGRPSPEDIPDVEDNDDDIHLGAESAPSVDTEPHKTHPAIH